MKTPSSIFKTQPWLFLLLCLSMSVCQAKDFGPYGGSGQSAPFNVIISQTSPVVTLNVWSGDFVDAIQFVYADGSTSPKIGGPGGTLHPLPVAQFSEILSVTYGAYLNQILFQGVTLGGVSGSTPAVLYLPIGRIRSVSGRSGKFIDSITFTTVP